VEFLIIAILLTSCSLTKINDTGRVDLNDASGISFNFSINEERTNKDFSLSKDKNYPEMTELSAKLLMKILKRKKYCLNKEGKIDFMILSRQEKIYDITYSGLIEQSYSAKKPLSPIIYYGKCK
jgi:hypothetical protein